MSDIGFFKTSVCREVEYSGKGPPIEVEIEMQGMLYCDDSDWGVEVRDMEAKIVERELDDDEMAALNLESDMVEAFSGSDPVPPKIGERFRGPDGAIWTIAACAMVWDQAERYVLIERENPRWIFKGPRKLQRLVHTGEFTCGYREDETGEYRLLFEPVIDPKDYPEGSLKPLGYVDESASVWD